MQQPSTYSKILGRQLIKIAIRFRKQKKKFSFLYFDDENCVKNLFCAVCIDNEYSNWKMAKCIASYLYHPSRYVHTIIIYNMCVWYGVRKSTMDRNSRVLRVAAAFGFPWCRAINTRSRWVVRDFHRLLSFIPIGRHRCYCQVFRTHRKLGIN